MTVISRSIHINGLQLLARIGVHETEIRRPQPVVVDIEAFLDPPTQDINDNISNVLDYDLIRNDVLSLVENRAVALQETLCADVVRALAKYPQISSAVVSVRKTTSYPDCDSVGVRMSYAR